MWGSGPGRCRLGGLAPALAAQFLHLCVFLHLCGSQLSI